MASLDVVAGDADRGRLVGRSTAGLVDRLFYGGTLLAALVAPALILWIGWGLYAQSAVARHLFGWRLLTGSSWDVPHEVYGALPYVYGTAVASAIALVIAVPVGIGCAIFLSEVAPRWLAAPIAYLVELLAAVPSVIFGLWGFLVMCPWLQMNVNPWLAAHLGAIPLFAGPPVLTNVLAGGLILAIMILPFITSVSREVMRLVPAAQRDASLGLGATKWETIRLVVLRGARVGIIGAVVLALGRAIGETMAVVMVIGNTPQITASLLQPGYTMPGLLANQFNEAQAEPVQRSALIGIALILFVMTLAVNAFARLLIVWSSPEASRTNTSRWSRVREAAGRAVGSAAAGAGAIAIVSLLAADVRANGLRALADPPEILLYLYCAWLLVAMATKGKPVWRRLRKANGRVMYAVVSLCAALACALLGLLLAYITIQGARALNVAFFTRLPGAPDEVGGMKNGIVGTLELVGIAGCIGIPIGLLGGIYLAEFGRNRLGGWLRFAADVLNGVPSVVIGMFGYAAFVLPVGHFSAISGGAVLGIMMLPTVVRTTDEMLGRVPDALRDASLGLGASRYRTMRSVLLPAARTAITTGALLAIARIAGETAPLLFTAFGNDQMSTSLTQPVSSLTMMIYKYALSPYQNWIDQAWAGALVLLALVLVTSLASRVLTRNRYALQ